jgi:hypothetical protein
MRDKELKLEEVEASHTPGGSDLTFVLQTTRRKALWYTSRQLGLFLAKSSVMKVSIPLDLPSRSFIPLPRFILVDLHLLSPLPLFFILCALSGTSLVSIFAGFCAHHSFSVTMFSLK